MQRQTVYKCLGVKRHQESQTETLRLFHSERDAPHLVIILIFFILCFYSYFFNSNAILFLFIMHLLWLF